MRTEGSSEYPLSKVYEEIDKKFNRYVGELREFVRQPSISARGIGIEETSEMLLNHMQKIGIQAKVIPQSEGNPVVYGSLEFGGNKKTLLVYSHYDVQPPGSPDEWIVGPFSAEIINGRLYGRGAADAKGNLLAFLNGVDAFIKTHRRTPVNLIFLFDGEEEVGSVNLEKFVIDNKDLFRAANAKILFDVRQDHEGRPMVNLGWKGMLKVEIVAKGPATQIHSMHAPIVENPAWRLIMALNILRNEEKVLIEGFYDGILKFDEEDLRLMSKIPLDEQKLAKSLGVKTFKGNIKGSEVISKLLTEPTYNINGVASGYTGEGMSSIIPSMAVAKMDFRLVPGQHPKDILLKLKKHLVKNGFEDLDVKSFDMTEPSKTRADEEIVRAVIKAAEELFDAKVIVYPLMWGTAPDYVFTEILNLPSVGSGCGYLHVAHKSNEYIELEQYSKGIKLAATIMNKFNST